MLPDVLPHRIASGHDAEVVISTVTIAHDIGRWRSEGLRPLWFNKAIFIVFVGVADRGFIQYPFAAAS